MTFAGASSCSPASSDLPENAGVLEADSLTAGIVNALRDQTGFWGAAGDAMTPKRTRRRAKGPYVVTAESGPDPLSPRSPGRPMSPAGSACCAIIVTR